MEKKILRLKLTDFLGKDIEEDVMFFLQQASKELQFELKVFMWYIVKICDQDDITQFKKRYYSDVESLNISIGCLNCHEETVWYDIISKDDSSLLTRFKFRSTYCNYTEIPGCIMEFSNFAKSYGYNRYGTRINNKNSSNGLYKVGRQTEDKRRFIRPQETVGK